MLILLRCVSVYCIPKYRLVYTRVHVASSSTTCRQVFQVHTPTAFTAGEKHSVEVHREFLVGKPEGKRLLERPSCRWKDNIKVDL